MSLSNCKLCLKPAALCRSHIIPEFCYEPFYDEKHRYIVATISEGKIHKPQKGIYERLLCKDCESKTNVWEKHVRRLFLDTLQPVPGSKALHGLPQLRYDFTKLFILSVLWRASVASDAMFCSVNLSQHEEKIRRILMSGVAPPADVYAVQIFRIFFEGNQFVDFMLDPTYFKKWGCRVYRIMMRGFLFFIFISSHRPPDSQVRFCIGPSTNVQIIDMKFTDFPFLVDSWNRASAATAHIP